MRRQRLHSRMKRLEIVVEAALEERVIGLIRPHATGYTLLPDASGFGRHGRRDRNMTIIVTVVTELHCEAIVEALVPALGDRCNVVLISDVTVLRPEPFIPEVRAATAHAR